MNTLLEEIQKWSYKYEFSFQFWGEGYNQVWIYKDLVELFMAGGRDTPEEIIIEALQYVYRINRVPKIKRVC